MLEGIHTFFDTDPALGRRGYPSIELQDNGDGTYQGKLDLAHISPSQKLMARVDLKIDAISEKLGFALT